ncbi:MAG: dTDP-glucose 4,6-dehydratase [Candidatus Pacebacteria bacterium]|nr:dTDP-glucose 4,6-dehydratase [Candidatus Paceibacterota bacterium]
MKLFVTGGAGFIGSNFVLYWLCHHPDDIIVNYDALTYAGNLENIKELEGNSHHIFVRGDICDAVLVEQSMKACDMVVHFAAESHVDRSIMDPSAFVKTNVLGTQVLLDAAKKIGVQRFHHVSTDEVFGSLDLGSSEKFNESTSYSPHSPYSASKAGSDHLVRAYADTYGLPITITNCSNNYGPYQFPEKLFGLAITNILEEKKVPVYTPGNQVRDWLFVEDHCRAIELVLLKGKVGETYCVGGLTKDVTNMEIVKMILSLMGKGEDVIELVKDRPGHDVRYAIDWTKIQKELGWEPTVILEQGLQKTVEWYTTHQEWWKNIKSGSYTTYYEKQYTQR